MREHNTISSFLLVILFLGISVTGNAQETISVKADTLLTINVEKEQKSSSFDSLQKLLTINVEKAQKSSSFDSLRTLLTINVEKEQKSSSFDSLQTLLTTNVEKEQLIPSFDSIETIFQRLQAYQKIDIVTNLDSFLLNRRSDKEQPAHIRVTGEDQVDIALDIKIRPRGRFRRMKCDLPPIRLNFWKPDLDSLQLYRKYDKLKLVTHCKEDATNGQLLLKEYWTYKLYNQITDNSFKIHLLEVNYIHEEDSTRTINSYAFVIENNAELAHRLGGELVKGRGIKPSALTVESYHHALLFNYMIGNTDWNLRQQKNLKLVRLKHHTFYTLIPYDFDFAKIVDAPYSSVDNSIKNLDKGNRAAQGTFTNRYALADQIALFQSLRKTGFRNYKKCPLLKQSAKVAMSMYINTFFQTIKNRKRMEKTFLPVGD